MQLSSGEAPWTPTAEGELDACNREGTRNASVKKNRRAASIESGKRSCGREFDRIPTLPRLSDADAFLPRRVLVGCGGPAFGYFAAFHLIDLHSGFTQRRGFL